MSLSRILFYVFNIPLFNGSGLALLKAFLFGIRFDISAMLYINVMYILLISIPFPFRNNPVFQKIAKGFFISTNAIALLANFADIIYYRFTLKRTTADIFSYFGVGGDFDKLLPQFLRDFWYIALIWILFIVILFLLYRKPISFHKKEDKNYKFYIKEFSTLIFIVGISILGMRGGFQLRPINIVSASLNVESQLSPVVLNTPFTILQTIGKQNLELIHDFEDNKLDVIYSPIHNTLLNNLIPDSSSTKQNIVIIIVESLSQEHISYYNPDVKKVGNLTPFLDSLCNISLCFNGFANGKKSIEGIPALISGIPTLMPTPFIGSAYSNNQHLSLSKAVKEMNYATLFFHGGTNGTMGFDSYSKNVGFDHYFGRTEYNNESDYDGHWGIWDEPYLQYCIKEMNKYESTNFLSVIFTLSSHHPYSLPEKYMNSLPKGKSPIHATIAYVDLALRNFFAEASKQKWFKNTLFVITADHTSEAYFNDASNSYGIFQIPMIFYNPSKNLAAYSKQRVFQQIDLLPTLLAYLKYTTPVCAFGSNQLDTNSKAFAIQYIHPAYQINRNGYLLNLSGETANSMYKVPEDSLLKNNLINKNFDEQKHNELFLKAFIQQYNNRLIRNQLTPNSRK